MLNGTDDYLMTLPLIVISSSGLRPLMHKNQIIRWISSLGLSFRLLSVPILIHSSGISLVTKTKDSLELFFFLFVRATKENQS